MKKCLDDLLAELLTVCAEKAVMGPVPTNPSPDSWENEADEYVRRIARSGKIELPSPEAAAAMLPRITFSAGFGSAVECSFSQKRKLGDKGATRAKMLEFLLIDNWRDVLKPKWISGKIQMRQLS